MLADGGVSIDCSIDCHALLHTGTAVECDHSLGAHMHVQAGVCCHIAPPLHPGPDSCHHLEISCAGPGSPCRDAVQISACGIHTQGVRCHHS